jgi:hypothetical protein
MMLIASLVEFAIAKRRMRQKHNAHLPNFDVASLRVTATATTQQADVYGCGNSCQDVQAKLQVAAR